MCTCAHVQHNGTDGTYFQIFVLQVTKAGRGSLGTRLTYFQA